MFEVKMKELTTNEKEKSFNLILDVVYKGKDYTAYVYCDEFVTLLKCLFKNGEDNEGKHVIEYGDEFGENKNRFLNVIGSASGLIEQQLHA